MLINFSIFTKKQQSVLETQPLPSIEPLTMPKKHESV